MAHTLVIGPSGIGKTELFGALAKRANVNMLKVVGKERMPKVCEKLLRLKPNDIIVFDEGHNQDSMNQEMLYEVIDTGQIPARCLPDPTASAPANVAPCTVVFATDQPGQLLKALVARLPQRVWLVDYLEDEMREIVARVAERESVLLSPQAARQVARVSNGLPRRARDHVRSIRRYFRDSERTQIGVPQVESWLVDKGISCDGLTAAEFRYMGFLLEEERASIETIAAVLGVDAEYVRVHVEQPLLYRKLVRIGGSGRSLTKAGVARLAALPAVDTGAEEEAHDAPAGKGVSGE